MPKKTAQKSGAERLAEVIADDAVEEAVLGIATRTVAVLAVALASNGSSLINYPDQFLSTAERVKRYIETGDQ